MDYQSVFHQLYQDFNARRADAVLARMHPDVQWPKAFEGGYISGQDAVRTYWTRQWTEIAPIVDPIAFTERSDGRLEVRVHQVVKDLQGNLLFDGIVKHVYTLEDNLLRRMDIELS